MTHVINHVRIHQQLEAAEEIRAFQVDTALNPEDPLTKDLAAALRYRHHVFLMGRTALGRKLWRESKKIKTGSQRKLCQSRNRHPRTTAPLTARRLKVSRRA